MPSVFTGTQYAEITAKAFTSGTVGAFTMIAVFKRSANSGGGDKYAFSICDTSGTNALAAIRFSGTDLIGYDNSLTSIASTLTVTTTDGWVAVGVTKATGNVKARFHKYVYSTGVASHEDSVGNSTNFTGGGSGTSFVLCRFRNNLTSFNALGSVAAAAVYPKQMSDQEFESAAAALSGLMAQDPSWGLLTLDAETARVIDLVGGAAQTTNTGAVDTVSSPFGYGFPVLSEHVFAIGALDVSPDAIASAEAFGSPTVTVEADVSPDAIASAEAFGSPTVTVEADVYPDAIASAEAFGSPTVTVEADVYPASISSAEAFGVPTVGAEEDVFPDSIPSGEAFGFPTVTVVPYSFAPATLGCATSYEVIAIEEIVDLDVVTGHSRYGRPLGPFEGFSGLVWDRRLDDTSEATLTIPTNSDCCASGFVAGLHPWHHGIAIYRNGELVWDGPIVAIDVTRTEVVVVARDVSALLSKRLLRRDLCFSSDPLVCTGGAGGVVYGPQSPEFVATTLISEGLAIDGHGALVTNSGPSGTGLYEASYVRYGGPVFDLLQKLATDFINWTVLGRRIVVSHGGAAAAGLGRTALLTCDDFVNDTFKVTEDGLAALTQDVQVAAPVVVNGVEMANIGVGQIFPVGTLADAYYGLLQGVQDANKNLNVGDTSADPATNALTQAAINVVQGAYPPPLVLSADGLQLSPEAPVTVAELVPGTFVPIFADCLCKPVAVEFILSKVAFRFSGDGEVVEPTFISKGADNPGEGGS